ncbi:MAG: hypothetical protein NVV62_14460 [Terricaulis sp.]|nr:hypothetical protein [Terricaulis sp.]
MTFEQLLGVPIEREIQIFRPRHQVTEAENNRRVLPASLKQPLFLDQQTHKMAHLAMAHVAESEIVDERSFLRRQCPWHDRRAHLGRGDKSDAASRKIRARQFAQQNKVAIIDIAAIVK